jgi:hypothetical protein
MTPQTDDAWNDPMLRDFIFPAAILHPPYFDPSADLNGAGSGPTWRPISIRTQPTPPPVASIAYCRPGSGNPSAVKLWDAFLINVFGNFGVGKSHAA